ENTRMLVTGDRVAVTLVAPGRVEPRRMRDGGGPRAAAVVCGGSGAGCDQQRLVFAGSRDTGRGRGGRAPGGAQQDDAVADDGAAAGDQGARAAEQADQQR